MAEAPASRFPKEGGWECKSAKVKWFNSLLLETQISSLFTFTRTINVWERLRTSFWFLPATMAVGAIVLSFVLVEVDALLSTDFVQDLSWLYLFGPDGARAILSAIASSMITVAGLTFSITMLTLQLASSQFGPRLLRNFMRDRGNQIVLGTFIATFVYCLLVLRTVRGTESSSFVPHISVAVGVLLALASIAVLIYFIHHVASSIRIETLLAGLADETREATDRLYPDLMGQNVPPSATAQLSLPEDFDLRAVRVRSGKAGYIQRLDVDALMKLTIDHDLLVRVETLPGGFVTEHDPVFAIYPPDRVADDVTAEVSGMLVVGQERTPTQDLEFSIRRIVEIAQRALSPGVNDPTTALYCIDRLAEAFERLALREMPSALRADDKGHLRVMSPVTDLADLASFSFAAVARYGLKDGDVMLRLDTAMQRVAEAAQPNETAGRLLSLRKAIRLESQKELILEFDRKNVRDHGGKD